MPGSSGKRESSVRWAGAELVIRTPIEGRSTRGKALMSTEAKPLSSGLRALSMAI